MYNFVSIIIPTKVIDSYVKECLRGINDLDYKYVEVILLPDKNEIVKDSYFFKLIIIPTGEVKPSQKRNIGIKAAHGNIVAFIDSDAYPIKEWLKNAVKRFEVEDVGAVGGPNLTPSDDTIWQKASGDILSSPIGAGAFATRYMARHKFRKGLPVKELPSCNLLIRKDLIDQVNGFDTTLLTGEDSKLCFQIRKLGKKIIYDPDAQVYHHRRSLFRPHLKQVWIYGRDKAWVVKEDFSSDKLYYLIPFAFIITLIIGAILSINHIGIKNVYLALLSVYLIVAFIASLFQNIKRCFLIFPGIILTHISYGLGSLYGLLTKREGK